MLLTPIDWLFLFVLLLFMAIIYFNRKGYFAQLKDNASVSKTDNKACSILESHGFEILDRDIKNELGINIDNSRRNITMKSDYLVKKKNQNYAVRLKRGNLSKRLNTIATRRQLLEIFYTFNVSSLLLLDLEKERLQEVSFIRQSRKEMWSRVVVFLLGIIIGGILSFLRVQGGRM